MQDHELPSDLGNGNMDMGSGTWHVRSLYRSGSLKKE